MGNASIVGIALMDWASIERKEMIDGRERVLENKGRLLIIVKFRDIKPLAPILFFFSLSLFLSIPKGIVGGRRRTTSF
jgi:hypothetical protein